MIAKKPAPLRTAGFLGPDLSHWQSHVDFAQLAQDSRYRFAILKATEGTSYLDPTYPHRMAELEGFTQNLVAGSYHFGTGDDPEAQAESYAAAHPDPTGTLLCLDYERNPSGPSMAPAQARKWFARMRTLMPHKKFGLYASLSDMQDLGQDWSWVAAYRPAWPKVKAPNVILWQYSDGVVNETNYPSDAPSIGNCDMNLFRYSEAALRMWAK